MVLLHPVGLDGSFWGGLVARCAVDHTVVSVDIRGHGSSPEAERPGHMDARVAEIANLIAKLDGGPAILLGVSFGGMIAQNVAIAHPQSVSGLVLAACPGRIPEAGRAGILQRAADAEAGGMEAVVDTTLQRWFTPGYQSSAAVQAVRQRLLSDSVSGFAAAWEAVAEHDALDDLRNVDVPALVVAGEADEATPLDAKRALAEAIPGARLEIMEGAPHMMQIECADRFADIVRGFLDDVGDAA